MTIIKYLSIYFLLLLSLGCNADSGQTNYPKDFKLSPEQVKCVQNVMKMQIEQSGKFANLTLQLMQEYKSDIQLQVLERRNNEKLCMLELQCYGPQQPAVQGLIFGRCIKNLEQEL